MIFVSFKLLRMGGWISTNSLNRVLEDESSHEDEDLYPGGK